MRILKPGEPCPCCGQPIKEGLTTEKMMFLSYIAEGKTMLGVAGMFEEDLKKREEADNEQQDFIGSGA